MTTQSLRGLDNHGAMHWRGDRNGAVQQSGAPFLDGSGNPVVSAQPNSGIFDEFNGVQVVQRRLPGPRRQRRRAQRRRHDRLHDLHAPDRRTRRTRSAPRQLAHARRSRPATRSTTTARPACPSCRRTASTTATAATRSTATATRGRPSTPASSGPTAASRSRTSRRPSRCRTSATPTRRSACSRRRSTRSHAVGSVIPPLNPPLPAVRGFGFQHDGADGKLEHFFTAFVFIQTTVTVTFAGITNIPPNPYGIPLFANPADPTNPAYGISTDGLALRHSLADFVFAFDTNMLPDRRPADHADAGRLGGGHRAHRPPRGAGHRGADRPRRPRHVLRAGPRLHVLRRAVDRRRVVAAEPHRHAAPRHRGVRPADLHRGPARVRAGASASTATATATSTATSSPSAATRTTATATRRKRSAISYQRSAGS